MKEEREVERGFLYSHTPPPPPHHFVFSVRKNPDTGELQVSSKIYKITGFDNTAHSPLFPLEHPQNFCYISIKGIGGKGSRVVDIWYHSSDVYYQ